MINPRDMKTITKAMLVERICENHFDGHSMKTAARGALEHMLEIIIEQLSDNNIVMLKKHGKLVPKIKKGGRTVRNPKSGETSKMGTIATVTMPKTINKDALKTYGRVPTSLLTELLGIRCADNELAKATISEFLKALEETRDGTSRIEIREFGVFSSREVKAGMRRNPKTGTKSFKEASLRPHFKVSGQVQDILLEKLHREVG